MAADPEIGLNNQRPELFNTLGSIMNFGNSALAYKKGVATLPADVARAQAESQTAQEQAQQQHLVTARAQLSNGAQQALSMYGTGATPDQVRDVMTTTMTNMGAHPDSIRQAVADIPTDQTQIDPFLVKKAQSVLGALDQINSRFPAPAMISTGSQIAPVTQGNPALTGVAPGQQTGPATPTTIAPSERQTLGTDTQGRPIVATKNNQGAITGVVGAPVSGQTVTPPFVMPTGENADTLAFVQGLRKNANMTASTVSQQQFNTNQIIHYAKNANTGTGAQLLNDLKGQFAGIPWTSNSASNFNMLGHAIALQTASLANSAGLNSSNEARGLAQEQTANQNWTQAAVITSARNMRALSTGTSLYNQGMENTIAKATRTQGPSAGQFAARTFQNQWSQVADVNAMRLYDAVKNSTSDPEGLKSVVTELGGPKSIQYQYALKKIDAMKAVISGGQ
jgi:hypothetical protein